jgi:hypothetical protein
MPGSGKTVVAAQDSRRPVVSAEAHTKTETGTSASLVEAITTIPALPRSSILASVAAPPDGIQEVSPPGVGLGPEPQTQWPLRGHGWKVKSNVVERGAW